MILFPVNNLAGHSVCPVAAPLCVCPSCMWVLYCGCCCCRGARSTDCRVCPVSTVCGTTGCPLLCTLCAAAEIGRRMSGEGCQRGFCCCLLSRRQPVLPAFEPAVIRHVQHRYISEQCRAAVRWLHGHVCLFCCAVCVQCVCFAFLHPSSRSSTTCVFRRIHDCKVVAQRAPNSCGGASVAAGVVEKRGRLGSAAG